MRAPRYLSDQSEWIVDGHRRSSGPEGELILVRDELSELRAVDLRRALEGAAEAFSQRAVVSLVDDEIDEDNPVGPVTFEWALDGLIVEVVHFAPWPEDDREETAIASVERLIAPLLADRHATAAVTLSAHYLSRTTVGLDISIKPALRGKTVADLVLLGEDLVELCEAAASGAPTRDTVVGLIRGGSAAALVGQPEGGWLDVKSQEYDLSVDHGRISLAEAVARFCNGDEGGIVLIGAEAKKVPGGEIIKRVRGVDVAPGAHARYRRAIDRHLYPPPVGLRVETIATVEGRSLVLINIPEQPEELKPFLVHGAIRADGRVEGAFISIVRRRDDESIPITAAMIHATLAAGRALLRGERPA